MAAPRRVTPGAVYLVTRRCCQRAFRLRPSDTTNAIFGYCLALALHKTGVRLHAVCVLSNHHHLVISDPHGTLPVFLQELHRLTAKALNAAQGQEENLWAAEPSSAILLASAEDVLDKIAFVAANPVAAGLVQNPEDWPGLSLWTPSTVTTRRPTAYFPPNSRCPDTLPLTLWPPPLLPESEAQRRLRDLLQDRVRRAVRSVVDAGRRFLHRAGVLAQSFARRAEPWEPKRPAIPKTAERCPALRAELRRIQLEFRAGYRQALREWQCGRRDVVFPFGTWWLRVFHGATAQGATG